MNPYIEVVLKKMFDIVGAPYIPKYVITDNWFQKYWWTSTEEEEFRDWLRIHIISMKGLRQALLRNPDYNEKMIDRAIDYFLMSYGWYTLHLNNLDFRDEEEPKGYYIKNIKKCLSKKHYKFFNEFMKGQTVALFKGVEIVYVYDFDKFKDLLKDRKRK